ncbi:MAG: hypothetical protein IJM63_05045 [Solobacterium sp.]|nr:hypothetical protein [Solobacterium sp.]MBQ9823843.1 hypothetical protein [Solobacterium sp.]
MKKMIRSILAFSLVCFMVLAAGCGSSAAASDKIAGTYNLYSMRDVGTEESELTAYLAEEQNITGVLELNEDGTGKYTFMYQEYEIKWDAEKKTISAEGSNDTFEYKDGVFEWTMGDKIHSFHKAEN